MLLNPGYYLGRSRPPSQRSIRHAWLVDQIRAVHAASWGTYGAHRVHTVGCFLLIDPAEGNATVAAGLIR
ncbi:hypothetical protein [Nocardia arthritidis]|uniref:Uncharacterized protein n=1 Tax=Nocardia arthritidis TaxID=228602 RepID=A0A6G9YKY3_9NOCA|nr:hypothetical protein [Nocardia arthritidis]QIS13965.1 hypothetical protein F5544_30610 [Nocardia arthritidis]